ncbi:ATP-dependent DNA ligase [Xanthomonas phage phi Xc10]|uniref:ATP-dependent DNA ligase n=1 Tax=Xanthomonas phage phi Xc10 TaxID=2024237 RepID=A0A249XLQ0_9CAUD|nr:ATP-dependent DNA ligase [Xanthomonas phage phi Xc10]ASZ72026.1 ATP-dependent DNA ligase [Xanthomonas phage phi Xc10]
MSYIVHKAVEQDKIKKKLRPTEEQLRTEYIAQPKYDGCNMVAIKRGHWVPTVNKGLHAIKVGDVQMQPVDRGVVDLFSRTSEQVVSAHHIENALASAPFFPVGVYFGEYWHPTIDQPTVSGMFRKKDGTQYTEPMFVVFDYVTLEEWEQGYSDLVYQERVSRLPSMGHAIAEGTAPVFYAESQGFLIDQELGSMEAAKLLCEGGAYDGLILRKPSGKWVKGDKGTNGEVVKIKPTLTLDLRVVKINMATGEKTGRDVWTVVVDLGDGKTQEVGSGVPHDSAALPVEGDIVEIEAMSFSKYGLLREPRYKGIRHDKKEADR